MLPNSCHQEFFLLWGVPNPYSQLFMSLPALKRAIQLFITQHPCAPFLLPPLDFLPTKKNLNSQRYKTQKINKIWLKITHEDCHPQFSQCQMTPPEFSPEAGAEDELLGVWIYL